MDDAEIERAGRRIALVGSRAMGAAIEAFYTAMDKDEGNDMVKIYRSAVLHIQTAVDHADEGLAAKRKLRP